MGHMRQAVTVKLHNDFQFLLNQPVFPEITPGCARFSEGLQKKSFGYCNIVYATL